jgi:predicted nucleic acid-binding protein
LIAYLDSSALVKQIVPEAGSRETSDLVARADRVGTAVVSRVEVTAALARAARAGRLGEIAAADARLRLQRLWPELTQIPLASEVIANAEHWAWREALRGYDAVQLASALWLQVLVRAPVVVACFDVRLRAAAAAAGLEVWPAMP